VNISTGNSAEFQCFVKDRLMCAAGYASVFQPTSLHMRESSAPVWIPAFAGMTQDHCFWPPGTHQLDSAMFCWNFCDSGPAGRHNLCRRRETPEQNPEMTEA
jgi:hypothetical protein